MSDKGKAVGAAAAASQAPSTAPLPVLNCCGKGDCEKATQALLGTAKTLAGNGDPRFWFANIHACISYNICVLIKEGKFQDPAWAEKVNVFFVNQFEGALTAQANGQPVPQHWDTAFTNCAGAKQQYPPKTAAAVCGEQMAHAHISVDLKNALVQHGVGTNADYDLIGGIVLACSKQGAGKLFPWPLAMQIWQGAPPLLQGLADTVPEWRQKARDEAQQIINQNNRRQGGAPQQPGQTPPSPPRKP